MGSLSREKKFRFLLASVAIILLVGLLSPPTAASNNVAEQKLHRLQVLGLDIEDPMIVRAASEAHALYSVDVVPSGDDINVVIQMSDVPKYETYVYDNKRRLVIDLYNTINITPTAEYSLGENDPIRMVRNAQYKVEPSIISRVVLDLEEQITPEIRIAGKNLIISTPMSAPEAPVELPIETLQPVTEPVIEEVAALASATLDSEEAISEIELPRETEVPSEVVSVPAIEVETEIPEVETMVAQAAIEASPEIEMPAEEVAPMEIGSTTKEVEPAEVSLEIEVEPAADEPEEILEVAMVSEDVTAQEFAETEMEEIAAEEIKEAMEIEEIETEAVEAAVEPEPIEVAEAEEVEAIEEAAEIVEIAEPEVVEVAETAVEEHAEDIEASEPIMLAALETETETVEIVETVEVAEVAEEISEETYLVEEIVEEEESDLPIEAPIEAAGLAEAEAAAKALNGMFDEMMEADAADTAEPSPEDAMNMLGEMFAGMAGMMKADAPSVPGVTGITPAVGAGTPEKCAPEETLITLVFRDADLSAVLDIIARKGNLNILAGKDIRGKVTVRLVDVPLDVALDAILNVNGYGYIKTKNIIRILPLSELGETINTVTETFNLSYATASEAKETLQSFLSSNGNIEVDERTNMLIITESPGNMDRVRSLIPQIDRRVQQVLIEVVILDSVLLDDADFGVSWGLLNTQDRSPNTREEEGSAFPDQINVTLPVGADALQVTFGTLLGDFDLNGFIDAVISDTDSRVLANPKVLTLNNEKATIEIVQEFPYNDVTQTSSGGQLSNITFKEIGTKLEVKPQITHDGHVILWIAPEQNSIAGTTGIGVPIVDTRKAETTLILKDHQTIVMGGLRENRNVNTLTKVPFLGDLPGVKYAFRNVQSDKQDSELLVFITVHIVESPVLLPEEKLKAEELANLPRHPNSTIELIRP